MEAISVALVMFSDASTLNSADISGINVIEQDKARLLNREPLFPKVVGYAEIARMTGVSRQRAAMFPKIATFPKPVIETSQGPLYSEHAVAAWAAKRGVKAGRPKTAEVPRLVEHKAKRYNPHAYSEQARQLAADGCAVVAGPQRREPAHSSFPAFSAPIETTSDRPTFTVVYL